MKIAVVTPWYPSVDHPSQGVFVEREVRAIRSAGIDARVIYLNRESPTGSHRRVGDVLDLGVNVQDPLSIARGIESLREAMAFAEVVHSHAISALPVLSARRPRQPWLHTEHWSALTAPESIPSPLRPFIGAIAALERRPDLVVAESERLAAPLRRIRRRRPVSVIPCVVEASLPLTERATGSALRLYSTGGLIDRKDPLLAVRTLAALRDRGVSASLRWVGEGPLRRPAEALAAELQVDAVFLGARPPKTVQAELAACDVFIAPTQGDNFFVAAAEALVAGRPLCASPNGGHVEYSDPRFTEIVPEQTPAAYAEAVIRLRDKTAGVSAAEISASVFARFSPRAIGRAYGELYRGLLDADPAAASSAGKSGR